MGLPASERVRAGGERERCHMHNKVQKPLRKRVPLSLIFWIIAVICSGGGGSEVTKGVWWGILLCERGAAKEGRTSHREKRQTDTQRGRTVALRFIQNGLNDGDNGGAQSAKRKPNRRPWPPGRFVPFLLTPTHWKLENSRTRRSQK